MNYKFLFLIFLFSFSAVAAEPNAVRPFQPASGDIVKDLKSLPKIGLEDAQMTYFNRDNLLLLLMAGGGSIALHDRADERIAKDFRGDRRLSDGADKFFDYLGNPGTHFAATGLWYWAANSKNNDLSLQRSWTMLRALSVTGATTLLLKGIVQNHTPNGKDWAWPSGHTSSSFTVAAVLDEFYGPKIGIPSYILAGLVGYRMMDSGDHWASDVLFGGVLGYVVGKSVAGHFKLEVDGFKVQPTIISLHDRPIMGAAIVKEF